MGKPPKKPADKPNLRLATKPTPVRADEDLLAPAKGANAKGTVDADGGPPDVFAKSQNHIATLLGLHKNTLTNWKTKGIDPIGKAPWSIKAFLLLLRRRGKLGECRTTTPAMRLLWKWAWGSAGEGSLNPDDPAHGQTENWTEERERQGALKELSARKSLNMDLEKKAGKLKEDDAVRSMLRELRQIILGELSTVQAIANQVRTLSPTARADLADLLTAWQAQARKRIATKTDTLMAAKDPAHGVPG